MAQALNIYKEGLPFEDLILYDYTYTASRMSDSPPTITGKVLSQKQILFQVKDEGLAGVIYCNPFSLHIEWNGIKYYLLRPPATTKNNAEERYEYDFTFVSPIKKLQDKLFVDSVVDSDSDFADEESFFSNSTTFSVAVTAKEYAQRLNSSGLKQLGFEIYTDDIPNTETKFITIDRQSYYDAIKLFKDSFELDYYYDNKLNSNGKIYIYIKEYDTIINDLSEDRINYNPFEYGSTNALMSITKTPKTDKVITRMTGIGSADNIPYYYPNETPKGGYLKLKLPQVFNGNDRQNYPGGISLNESNVVIGLQQEGSTPIELVKVLDKDLLNQNVEETDYFTYFEAVDNINPLYPEFSCTDGTTLNGITGNGCFFRVHQTSILTTAYPYTIQAKINLYSGSAWQLESGLSFNISEDIKLNNLFFSFDWGNFKNEIELKVTEFAQSFNNYQGTPNASITSIKNSILQYIFNTKSSNDEIPEDGWIDFFIKIPKTSGSDEYIEFALANIGGYYQIPYDYLYNIHDTFPYKGQIYARLKHKNSEHRIGSIISHHSTTDILDWFKQNFTTLFQYIQNRMFDNILIHDSSYVHIKDINVGNDAVLDFSKYGLQVGQPNYPYYSDLVFERPQKYINPSPNLMPSIYRNSEGNRRFYDAINYPTSGGTADVEAGEYSNGGNIHNRLYKDSNNNYFDFDNPLAVTGVIEEIKEFEEIKPSIEYVNNQGHSINQILDVAFDCQDEQGNVDWNAENSFKEIDGNKEYEHPYFFVKLPALGFNLFTHASEKGAMSISMTSGHSASCTFEIGVSEKKKQNFVAIDENGNLVRDNDGDVICNRRVYVFNPINGRVDISNTQIDWTNANRNKQLAPQPLFDKQNDTTENEVWICLKKDLTTFGYIMPSFDDSILRNDKYVLLNIGLPHQYILKAEEELSKKIIKELYDLNRDKVSFNLDFSSIFFEEDKSRKQNPNDYIINKLTENSCVYVKYLSKTYRLLISSYTETFTSEEVLPKVSISVKEDIVPLRRWNLQRPNRFGSGYDVVVAGGLGGGSSIGGNVINNILYQSQRTIDDVGLGTSGIYEDTNEVSNSILTTDKTFKSTNFGSTADGNFVFKTDEKNVVINKFYENTQKDLGQLKTSIEALSSKVNADTETEKTSIYYWYGDGSVAEMLEQFKDDITTLNVIVKLTEDDYKNNPNSFIIDLITYGEEGSSIISQEQKDNGEIGYVKYRKYEFIFETQITDTHENLKINIPTKEEPDTYIIGQQDKFIIELSIYEDTFSYLVKHHVPQKTQELKEDIEALRKDIEDIGGDIGGNIKNDIDGLKTDVESIKETIKQIKIPITKEDRSIKVNYGKGIVPNVGIWNTESENIMEECVAKVNFINNSTIEIKWNIGINGFIVIN